MTRRARLIRRVLLFGTLGLLTNVAVAWSIAWWVPWTPSPDDRSGLLTIEGNEIAVDINETLWRTNTFWAATLGNGVIGANAYMSGPIEPGAVPAWSWIWDDSERARALDARPSFQHLRMELAYGFPLRAFACLHHPTSSRSEHALFASYRYPINRTPAAPIAVQPYDLRALPIRPVWTGLVINTLFFGALWYALLAAPALVRRRSRQRRGACLTCGYDLRGLAPSCPCPECGAPRTRITAAADHIAPI